MGRDAQAICQLCRGMKCSSVCLMLVDGVGILLHVCTRMHRWQAADQHSHALACCSAPVSTQYAGILGASPITCRKEEAAQSKDKGQPDDQQLSRTKLTYCGYSFIHIILAGKNKQ